SEAAKREREAGPARRRREESRVRCEMFYALYSPEIGPRFPKEAFADFCQRYLGDDRTPEDVERRAGQLLETMQQHLRQTGRRTSRLGVAELAAWYQQAQAQMSGLPVDERQKRLLLAQLNK